MEKGKVKGRAQSRRVEGWRWWCYDDGYAMEVWCGNGSWPIEVVMVKNKRGELVVRRLVAVVVMDPLEVAVLNGVIGWWAMVVG